MLSGIAVVIIWSIVFVVAMAETSLNFASQAKLKEAIKEDGRLRDKFLNYYDRAPAARPYCIAIRVIGISLLFLLILPRLPHGSGNSGLIYWAAPAIGAVCAELGGRYMGKRWATHSLLILLPVLQLFAFLTPLRKKKSNGTKDKKNVFSNIPEEHVVDAAIEEIRVAIHDAAEEGAIHHDEREMIEGVLEFEDVEVHEIMTPRTEIECLNVNDDEVTIKEKLADFHHTRIPVYEDVRDKVIGILHVKDLVPDLVKEKEGTFQLRRLMQKPFFIPETKRAMSLLHDFKQRHLQIAVILDEYGGVTGMVTMEDIMEQIVGELEEGFEAEKIEDRIRMLGGGALDVDARLHVDEINRLLNVDLPEHEDYDTIGGFLMAQFAGVPQKDERLEYNNVLLKVLSSNDRRVHRVLVKKTDNTEN